MLQAGTQIEKIFCRNTEAFQRVQTYPKSIQCVCRFTSTYHACHLYTIFSWSFCIYMWQGYSSGIQWNVILSSFCRIPKQEETNNESLCSLHKRRNEEANRSITGAGAIHSPIVQYWFYSYLFLNIFIGLQLLLEDWMYMHLPLVPSFFPLLWNPPAFSELFLLSFLIVIHTMG